MTLFSHIWGDIPGSKPRNKLEICDIILHKYYITESWANCSFGAFHCFLGELNLQRKEWMDLSISPKYPSALDRNTRPRAIYNHRDARTGGGNLIFISIPGGHFSLHHLWFSNIRIAVYCARSCSIWPKIRRNERAGRRIWWIDKHRWSLVWARGASYPWWLCRHWLKVKLGQAA